MYMRGRHQSVTTAFARGEVTSIQLCSGATSPCAPLAPLVQLREDQGFLGTDLDILVVCTAIQLVLFCLFAFLTQGLTV